MAARSVLQPFANGRFSLYFGGQVVSNTGTWFQNLALSLVVLGETGSAGALSGVTVAQFLPLFILGVPAGRLADRVRPRTILLVASLLSAVIVCALAFATLSSDASVVTLYALVAGLGAVNTFDRVAAQAIIFEIVGAGELSRAVSLSTIAAASARSIGPGLAGIVFQGFGPTVCMFVNAASFLLVFASVAMIRPSRLHPREARAHTPAAEPYRVRDDRALMTLLIVNVAIALLALNLMLVLTSTVVLTFRSDAAAVGALHTLNAVGAILGGLVAASRTGVSARSLAAACACLGVALLANAVAPTLLIFLLLGPVLGWGVGYYQGVLNAAAQVSAPPARIGRIMSLVTLGNYGMVPFGALLMGWVIDRFGGSAALAIGAAAALACAVFVRVRLGRGGSRG